MFFIAPAMIRLVRRPHLLLLTLDLPRHVTGRHKKPGFRAAVTFITVLLTFLIVGSSGPVAAQNHVTGQVIGVESGDTIRVKVDDWTVSVRLHGIIAPEAPPALVERAREYVERRVADTRVKVEVRGTGTKQTLYGEVQTADGASLNEEMVRVGLARWASEYAPNRVHLGELENEANDARRGMWGDPTGANVPLPPPLAATLRVTPPPSPTPSPSPATPSPSPSATVSAVPSPTPPPETPVQETPTPEPTAEPPTPSPLPATEPIPLAAPPTPPRFNRRVTDIAWPALAFLTAFFFILLQRRSKWETRCIPAQLVTAVLLAAGGTMLLPLPILLLGGRFTVTAATIAVSIAAPLAALCLWAAAALSRREQILRGTPQRPITKLTSGLVRVAGETSAPAGLAQSLVGRIPGIYIREVTWRYEPDPQRGAHGKGRKRVVPHNWVKKMDETRAADFVITDESGSVTVEGERATFHPLRVARFYNDIPVEEFFDKPYSGDTRTEVYFIPATSNVTVWGRAYRTASPVPGASEERIGNDPTTVGLIVVEENPARVYSGRASLGLLLTLGAIALAAAATYGMLAPNAFARFFERLFGGGTP